MTIQNLATAWLTCHNEPGGRLREYEVCDVAEAVVKFLGLRNHVTVSGDTPRENTIHLEIVATGGPVTTAVSQARLVAATVHKVLDVLELDVVGGKA